MPYVPLNKITTDLYTYGGEYVFQDSLNIYVGPYHKYYNGEVYTNTTPDIPGSTRLIKISKAQTTAIESDDQIALDIGIEVEHPDLTQGNIEEQIRQLNESHPSKTIENYLQAKNLTIQQYKPKKTIQSYNPEPTQSDYQVGEFQRYFLKQINTLKYVEVDKDTYTAITSRNPEYNWEYYTAITLPWTITGDQTQTGITNRNIVQLVEKLQNIQGLGAFLQFNYLKFYKK